MKKLTLLVFLLSAVFYSSAQSVQVVDATITPAPLLTLEENGTGTGCITLVETTGTDVPQEAFAGFPNVTVSISMQDIELTAADVSGITGPLLNYFSVTYNASNDVLRFTQNAVIPGGTSAQACFPITVVQNSTAVQSNNGFNANINASGGTTDAPGSASVYTYTSANGSPLVDDVASTNEDSPVVI